MQHKHCKLLKNMEEKLQNNCAKTGVPKNTKSISLSPVNIHVSSTEQILSSNRGKKSFGIYFHVQL